MWDPEIRFVYSWGKVEKEMVPIVPIIDPNIPIEGSLFILGMWVLIGGGFCTWVIKEEIKTYRKKKIKSS